MFNITVKITFVEILHIKFSNPHPEYIKMFLQRFSFISIYHFHFIETIA